MFSIRICQGKKMSVFWQLLGKYVIGVCRGFFWNKSVGMSILTRFGTQTRIIHTETHRQITEGKHWRNSRTAKPSGLHSFSKCFSTYHLVSTNLENHRNWKVRKIKFWTTKVFTLFHNEYLKIRQSHSFIAAKKSERKKGKKMRDEWGEYIWLKIRVTKEASVLLAFCSPFRDSRKNLDGRRTAQF